MNVHAFRQHHLYGRRSVNTSVISGYYQAIGAFPLTVISKLGASTFRGNYARGGGIVILPTGAIASPSPVVYWGWLFNGQRLLTAVRHSALGSWATDIGSTAVGALSEAAYVRFRFNSATSVDIEWSADGYAWISLVAAYNPGWTMDKFGVGFSSEGGGVPLECTWDFVRAT